MEKLNKREVAFLNKLRDLLKEFSVSITGEEYSSYSGGGCEGLSFYGSPKDYDIDKDGPYKENVISIYMGRIVETEDVEYLLEKGTKR